jgi:hypothetical protein
MKENACRHHVGMTLLFKMTGASNDHGTRKRNRRLPVFLSMISWKNATVKAGSRSTR